MQRIIFTGAQGTGKTTILNEMKDRGYNVITEVVRNLSKKGVKINKDGDEKGQEKIFKEYEKLLSEKNFNGYISDRGLIDVVAYTVYLARNGKVSEEFANKQLKKLHKFIINNPDIFYCYFPIEFPVVDDGVRDMDEKFRSEINDIIINILGVMGIKFVKICGTVEERMRKINKLIDWVTTGEEMFEFLYMIEETDHQSDPE